MSAQVLTLPCASGAQSFFSSSTVMLVDPRVLRVDHHRDAVVRDRQLDVVDAVGLAGLDLARLDRARGAGDGDLLRAQLLEAAAGARRCDRDARRVRLLELFGHRLADREHGARAVDGDRAGAARHFVRGFWPRVRLARRALEQADVGKAQGGAQ